MNIIYNKTLAGRKLLLFNNYTNTLLTSQYII
jgi:hypothetical protein